MNEVTSTYYINSEICHLFSCKEVGLLAFRIDSNGYMVAFNKYGEVLEGIDLPHPYKMRQCDFPTFFETIKNRKTQRA